MVARRRGAKGFEGLAPSWHSVQGWHERGRRVAMGWVVSGWGWKKGDGQIDGGLSKRERGKGALEVASSFFHTLLSSSSSSSWSSLCLSCLPTLPRMKRDSKTAAGLKRALPSFTGPGLPWQAHATHTTTTTERREPEDLQCRSDAWQSLVSVCSACLSL